MLYMLTDNMKLLVVLALVTMAVCLTEGYVFPKCDLRAGLTLQIKYGKLKLLPAFYPDMTDAEIVDKREYLFVYNCLEMYAFSSVNADDDLQY